MYLPSIFRPWLPFDERLLFNETLFPIPRDFSEMQEIIKTFGLNYHVESMNNFFSNNLTIRSNPLAAIFVIFTLYLFKTNAYLYHFFQIILHLFSTTIVWFILYNIVKICIPDKGNTLNKSHYLIVSLLTLFWGIHSASTEAVLLVTNNDAILTYIICFLFILFEIRRFVTNNFNASFFHTILFASLFCMNMLITEYGYTLPAIIFFLLLAFSYKQSSSALKAFKQAFRLSLPYFWGLVLFVVISLTRTHSPLENLTDSYAIESPLYAFLERNLWLTPQIFLYLLKLLLFPVTLSTYQSNLTEITDTLINPYSIFSTFIYIGFLVSPIILFFIFKNKKFSYIFLLLYAFYFALFPFLHIILPTYCLSADRYCYFPVFFMSLIALTAITYLLNKENIKPKTIFIPLICLVSVFSIRTLVRISDWKDADTLYKSAIKIDKEPLYKGHKLIIYGDYIGAQGKQYEMENALQESLREFNKALSQYKERKEKISSQPLTLKLYGLDLDSLIFKAAYGIATIRNDNYREDPNKILEFYEPYVKDNPENTFPNQIDLYSNILVRANRLDDAIDVLKKGIKKYPYSSSLIYSLVDHLLKENKLDEAYKYLKLAKEYFPNQVLTLYKLARYYEAKGDLENLAKYAYLIGLRRHTETGYLKAAKLYLELKNLQNAKLAIKKLIRLTGENPTTILLTAKYLDLEGRREQILPLLLKAYALTKTQGNNQDMKITKSILASLIGTSIHYGKDDIAKEYLKEFESLKNLTQKDRNMIFELKQKLST